MTKNNLNQSLSDESNTKPLELDLSDQTIEEPKKFGFIRNRLRKIKKIRVRKHLERIKIRKRYNKFKTCNKKFFQSCVRQFEGPDKKYVRAMACGIFFTFVLLYCRDEYRSRVFANEDFCPLPEPQFNEQAEPFLSTITLKGAFLSGCFLLICLSWLSSKIAEKIRLRKERNALKHSVPSAEEIFYNDTFYKDRFYHDQQ